ncbi:MAG: hypothetical protein KDJ52_12385 [Anaerolineae bacterium]|nr:hypothetical protein [Anaerolineae bacterium]
MLTYERISGVVSLTLIGLALYFVLNFPVQVTSFMLLGSPLTVDSPQRWLMIVLLGVLAMAGADTVIRTHPALSSRKLGYLATFWVLPGLLVILATQTLGLAPSPLAWAGGLVIVGLLLWLTILTEFRQVAPAGSSLWSRLWQQFIGYAIALLFFIVIYQSRSRSLMSATGVMLVGGMVALSLLRSTPEQISKTWIFAAIIGLSLGQITWALNYWRTGTLNAGLLIFLVFYVLVGVAQQQLLGTLTRRTLAEFGAIAAIALAVILNL